MNSVEQRQNPHYQTRGLTKQSLRTGAGPRSGMFGGDGPSYRTKHSVGMVPWGRGAEMKVKPPPSGKVAEGPPPWMKNEERQPPAPGPQEVRHAFLHTPRLQP